MRMKKMIAMILSVVLCLLFAVGCGSNANVDETVSTGGADASEVVFSVADDKITVKEFCYYVYMAAMETAYELDPNVANDISSFNWKQKGDAGEPLENIIIDKALNSALRDSIMIEKAKKNGIVINKEELKNNNQSIENAVVQNGEEAFLLSANAIGISDIEGYKSLANRMMALENAQKDISENLEKYMEPDVDLIEWKSTDKVTAQHVLISNESEKFSDPEATAKEVLAKAKAGEDFATLIEEYNEDPGATEAGYTFGRGEMVKEFEEASFALECGEISDVVKTEYGYHIIRRLAGLAELQNYWVNNIEYDLNEKVLAKISLKDIMTAASNAQIKLQSMNQAQQDNK